MMPFSECHNVLPSYMLRPFYPALIATATAIFAGNALAQSSPPTPRELNCQPAPDDCAALHVCLSDGRSVEGYTTPGFRGRTWLADTSTGAGCLGQLNEDRPSGLLCMNMARQDTDDFLVTVTQAPDGSLSGSGTLEDGTDFEVFGHTDPSVEVTPDCSIPLG